MTTFDPMFVTTFDRVIGHEGGFTADPKDRGNWTGGKVGVGQLKGTKFGISAMTYPSLDIKNLTEQQAKEIYYRDWWVAMKMERFHKAVRYQMFDTAINSSMTVASQCLQRAIGVKADGIIGPVTAAAVAKMDISDVLLLFVAERLEFFTNISTWSTYGKGWTRRAAQNLRYAAQDN